MRSDYVFVIVGGSIAGAALGFAVRRAGARVLIVELEPAFRDRVRGEGLHPWGVAEAQRLGLYDSVVRAPAQPVQFWDTYIGGAHVDRRDLVQTTPSHLCGFNLHHPEFQEALLGAAEAAGVEVRRGEKVTRVEPGTPVAIEIGTRRVLAQMAVIADGRHSPLRRELGVRVSGEVLPTLMTGVLLAGVMCDASAIGMFLPAEFGAMILTVPLPRDRMRLYFVHRADAQNGRSPERQGYSGAARVPALLERCVRSGVPSEWLAQARAIGPLATFDTTCWTLADRELPRGVVFAGDAAGNVDPVFGCGQSLALRDARVWNEQWRACGGDLQLAAARYLAERRAYHRSLLRAESWLTRILYTLGPEGDALRAVSFTRVPELGIDLIGAGPESPTDDATEARLFAGAKTG
jgi:2-polyprenyl-6-methoxyphenol hydroxylase-like FAD-dependent oxidoreductase